MLLNFVIQQNTIVCYPELQALQYLMQIEKNQPEKCQSILRDRVHILLTFLAILTLLPQQYYFSHS